MRYYSLLNQSLFVWTRIDINKGLYSKINNRKSGRSLRTPYIFPRVSRFLISTSRKIIKITVLTCKVMMQISELPFGQRNLPPSRVQTHPIHFNFSGTTVVLASFYQNTLTHSSILSGGHGDETRCKSLVCNDGNSFVWRNPILDVNDNYIR